MPHTLPAPTPPTTGVRDSMGGHRWAYGVMTVPERRDTLLPRTLSSLARAGFDSPHLFVDGSTATGEYHARFGELPFTGRYPKIRCYGNWVLGLWELYIRNPTATRFAMFQDDLIAVRDLRAYLDRSPYPGGDEWVDPALPPGMLRARPGGVPGYLNLYTMPPDPPASQKAPPLVPGPAGHGSMVEKVGWYESNQFGKGALGLVFSRAAVVTLLTRVSFVMKAMSVNHSWHNIDGGISDAFKHQGWREYIHHPSLIQHTGTATTMGPEHIQYQQAAVTFPGEEKSALEFLPRGTRVG